MNAISFIKMQSKEKKKVVKTAVHAATQDQIELMKRYEKIKLNESSKRE